MMPAGVNRNRKLRILGNLKLHTFAGFERRTVLTSPWRWDGALGRRERSDRSLAPERAGHPRPDRSHGVLPGGSPWSCERSLDRHRLWWTRIRLLPRC